MLAGAGEPEDVMSSIECTAKKPRAGVTPLPFPLTRVQNACLPCRTPEARVPSVSLVAAARCPASCRPVCRRDRCVTSPRRGAAPLCIRAAFLDDPVGEAGAPASHVCLRADPFSQRHIYVFSLRPSPHLIKFIASCVQFSVSRWVSVRLQGCGTPAPRQHLMPGRSSPRRRPPAVLGPARPGRHPLICCPPVGPPRWTLGTEPAPCGLLCRLLR